MFGSDCSGCTSVRDYEKAEKYYNDTKAPRGKYWEPNWRPLDDRRKPHYRLEQKDDGNIYDVVLHGTTMARYHKPTPEGRKVEYTWHNSNTSKAFLWRVVGLTKQCAEWDTTVGPRIVPIGHGGKDMGASLWLTPGGDVDIFKSRHAEVYVRRNSAEYLAWRRELHTALEPLVRLFEFCTEELRQGWEQPGISTSCHPGSLREMRYNRYSATSRLHRVDVQDIDALDLTTYSPKLIDKLRAVYTQCVETSLNVRDYRELPPPTTTDLARAASRAMLEQIEMCARSGPERWADKKYLGDFPEHVPQNAVIR